MMKLKNRGCKLTLKSGKLAYKSCSNRVKSYSANKQLKTQIGGLDLGLGLGAKWTKYLAGSNLCRAWGLTSKG